MLSSRKLKPKWKNKLLNLPRGSATLSNEELELKLEEPHPSWVKIIEDKWIQKYGSNN